jgi:hypothetical protein
MAHLNYAGRAHSLAKNGPVGSVLHYDNQALSGME